MIGQPRYLIGAMSLVLASACSLDWKQRATDPSAQPDDAQVEAGDLDADASRPVPDASVPGDGGDPVVDASYPDSGTSLNDAGTDAGEGRAPFIVAISPPDGADGVAAGAALVFTFSEPMNAVATQAAFQSADLVGTFSWNEAKTTMTVQPGSPLAYAAGTAPGTTTARAYAYTLTSVAEDAEGESLSAFSGSFRTLRRITTGLQVSGSPRQTNVGNVMASYCYDDKPNVTGASSSSDKFNALMLQFDLRTIPSEAKLEAATLSVHQFGATGSPFTRTQLGKLVLQHVFLGETYPANAVTSGTLSTLGVVSTSSASGVKQLSVVGAVRDDLDHRQERGDLSQYRIAFENVYLPTPAVDAYVTFACRFMSSATAEKLEITYLLR